MRVTLLDRRHCRGVARGAHATRPFSTFWFVTALVVVRLSVVVLSRAGAWVPWLVGAIGWALTALWPSTVAAVPFAAGVAVPAMVFFAAGRVVQRARAVRPLMVVLVAGGALAPAVVMMASGVAPFDLKYGQLGTPFLSAVCALLVCVGAVCVAQLLDQVRASRVCSAVSALAVCGVGVVLTHPAVLWVLDVPTSGSWTGFAAACVVPWVVMLALLRTRAAPLLLGRPPLVRRSW